MSALLRKRGRPAKHTPLTTEHREHIRTRLGVEALAYIEALEDLRRAIPEDLLVRLPVTSGGSVLLMGPEHDAIRKAANRLVPT